MPPKPKTKKNLETNEIQDSVHTNYDHAAYAIVQMINTFDSDPDATFQQEDFDILLQSQPCVQNYNSSMGISLWCY